MTAPQTPTPGIPLSAESVKLLKAGDVLRCTAAGRCSIVQAGEIVSTAQVAGRRLFLRGKAGLHSPDRFTFIGRPDAEGWMKAVHGTDLSGVSFEGDERPDGLYFRLTTPSDQGGEDSEGDKLPEGAICGTDDGQTVWLESSTGGAHRLGMWGGLSLRFTEADGSFVIRDYVATDAPTTPASGSDGLETEQAIGRLRELTSGWTVEGAEKASAVTLMRVADVMRLLVTREAAEKERAARLAAESQAAALKEALETARSLVQRLDGHDQEMCRDEIEEIDQALALKEGGK